MELQRFDLNLLKVFECVYRLRSLTQTAREMNLTQPAVSHALGRLRDALNDRLFIRTAAGLEPTSKSDEMAGPIKAALGIIDDCLHTAGGFDPATCNRTFTLLLSDVGELIFAPHISHHLQRYAPLARINVVQASRLRYADMLRDREADFAVGHLPNLNDSLEQQHLFDDRWVVIRGKERRAGTSDSLTLEQYIEAAHVETEPSGSPIHPIDMTLQKMGRSRSIVLKLPHFFALPKVIHETRALATVPYAMAINLRHADAFEIVELPFPSPPLNVCLYWHIRQDADAAMRWFRESFVTLFAGHPSEHFRRRLGKKQ